MVVVVGFVDVVEELEGLFRGRVGGGGGGGGGVFRTRFGCEGDGVEGSVVIVL